MRICRKRANTTHILPFPRSHTTKNRKAAQQGTREKSIVNSEWVADDVRYYIQGLYNNTAQGCALNFHISQQSQQVRLSASSMISFHKRFFFFSYRRFPHCNSTRFWWWKLFLSLFCSPIFVYKKIIQLTLKQCNSKCECVWAMRLPIAKR